MSVYLYPGGVRLIRKSGVGQAILHQQKALMAAGVPLAQTMGTGDIVHINTVFPDSLLIALRAKLSGKKVIYYAHSTMEDFRRSFPGSNWFAPLFKRWIRLCYQMGDVIITPPITPEASFWNTASKNQSITSRTALTQIFLPRTKPEGRLFGDDMGCLSRIRSSFPQDIRLSGRGF